MTVASHSDKSVNNRSLYALNHMRSPNVKIPVGIDYIMHNEHHMVS
jgi:hypothetical protein